MMNKCVHTEHCCINHGCKYGDDDCPVVTGMKKQSYLCEVCDFEDEQLSKFFVHPDNWYERLLPFCSTDEQRVILKEIYERAKNKET